MVDAEALAQSGAQHHGWASGAGIACEGYHESAGSRPFRGLPIGASTGTREDGRIERTFAPHLLEALRAETGIAHLDYARPPRLIPSGHETDVYDLALRGGPPSFGGALIARCFAEGEGSRPASFEAAVHEGLHGQGFPVPRVLAARDRAPAFLLMERLPGRSLADGVELGPDLRSRLAGMAAMARLSLALPERLGETTGRLLALDPEPVLDALRARGLPPDAIGFPRHLTSLAERVARAGLPGFEAGVRWLAEARPPEPERRAICHGDLGPNLLLEGSRVTGVIDWSPLFATVTDPAFEIANSRIMIQVPLPLPAWSLPISRSYQRHLVRRYARALGPRWAPSAERLRYYEAWRCLLALLGAAEHWRARSEGAPASPRPDPWHLPQVAIQVAEAFRERTGVAIDLPEPPD